MNLKKVLASSLALVAALAFSLPAFATRTQVTTQTPGALLNGAPSAGALDLVWTAADTTNLNYATFTGNEVLLVNNSGGSAYTVTVTSVPDSNGRSGDIATYSVAAGTTSWIGPIPTTGWQQSNGQLYFQGSNAALKFAVVKLLGSKIYQ